MTIESDTCLTSATAQPCPVRASAAILPAARAQGTRVARQESRFASQDRSAKAIRCHAGRRTRVGPRGRGLGSTQMYRPCCSVVRPAQTLACTCTS